MTSDGAASAVEAGPQTGRISGRPVTRHMASMTSRVNAPSTAEVPSRIVGAAWSTVSVSPTGAGVPTSQIWLRACSSVAPSATMASRS
jgi:hypothetical protein